MTRQEGECLTEAERLAILERVAAIVRANADGDLSDERARHELQTVLAPFKRRVRGLARRQGQHKEADHDHDQ